MKFRNTGTGETFDAPDGRWAANLLRRFDISYFDDPLREWTLGEIHDLCGGAMNCDHCPFEREDGTCPFYGTPNLWRQEENAGNKNG